MGLRALKPSVKIGIAGENDFEVVSGLTAGQTVVTGPFRILRELKEGARVELQKKGKDGTASPPIDTKYPGVVQKKPSK